MVDWMVCGLVGWLEGWLFCFSKTDDFYYLID